MIPTFCRFLNSNVNVEYGPYKEENFEIDYERG
jgi:hypothetical protein